MPAVQVAAEFLRSFLLHRRNSPEGACCGATPSKTKVVASPFELRRPILARYYDSFEIYG
jgi:hypothetical protein